MAVWIDLIAGPTADRPLDAAAFEALIVDLIRWRVVTRPCALLSGARLAIEQPLAVANAAQGVRMGLGLERVTDLERELGLEPDVRDVELLYQGGKSADLLAALRRAPWGEKDLAVWFAGFDWETLGDELDELDCADGDVVVYAAAKPQEVVILDGGEDKDAPLVLQFAFTVTGKGVALGLEGLPFEGLLRHHFGEEMVTGTSLS